MEKDRIKKLRTQAECLEHRIDHVHSNDIPGDFPDYDDKWDWDKFKKNFRFEIIKIDHSPDERRFEFDMVGIDASLANAFRRILLVEVPSMAADKVIIYNNTSVIQDEVLAHRLGLIPIKADPRLFEYRDKESENGTENNTIVFDLKVKCTKIKDTPKDKTNPDEIYSNHKVTTADLKWVPLGRQKETFSNNPPIPVFDDILIAKLRPGQEIDVTIHCVKGIGSDHIKFSPVGTASYRLLPWIELQQKVEGDLALRLQACFADGVIEVDDINGVKVARVANPRLDMCTREVFRHDDLKDLVKVGRVRNHFIFSIESTGSLDAEVLFQEAIKILIGKCDHFLDELKRIS